MLLSKKELFDCNPPFLIKFANGKWSLAVKISILNNNIKLLIVQTENGELLKRYFEISEPPFYVGAEVWELEYGSVLMTLNHPSLDNHPAKKLWEKWNFNNKEVNKD